MSIVQQYVDFYGLQPHPEGGWYSETYRSEESISSGALPGRFNGDRNFATGIYFLLQGDQFSAFHRIKSDEMWHFYDGGPLHIYVIHANGRLEIIKLGRDILNGETFQAVVPAGCWFASRPAHQNSFSFVGCTVAPGFDFNDFEMAEYHSMAAEFPEHATLIKSLTR